MANIELRERLARVLYENHRMSWRDKHSEFLPPWEQQTSDAQAGYLDSIDVIIAETKAAGYVIAKLEGKVR